MWPYWIMFLVPLWGVLSPDRMRKPQLLAIWLAVAAGLALTMGLRDQVGCDWDNYLGIFQNISGMDLGQVGTYGDPGYFVLNWSAYHWGWSIYAVNLVCACAMVWGTVVFCRQQANTWLALLVAVPYMLVVVGMGYTRQSAALGFAMLGLAALAHGRTRAFVMWVAIGALFHKSAVLLLPIAALAATRNRLMTWTLVGVISLLLYYLLVAASEDTLIKTYIDRDYQSAGGLIRVLMNVVPAAFLLLFARRLVPDPQERRLWVIMALLAFVCLPLVPLASTAVDRVALYLIPLQLFVFSRLPSLAGSVQGRTLIVVGVAAFYAVVEFVWLHYGVFSSCWAPYHFMPLGR